MIEGEAACIRQRGEGGWGGRQDGAGEEQAGGVTEKKAA
jgi:hypothetical protein